jgi:hypothetical protein
MKVEPSIGPLTPPTFPPVFFISIFVGDLVGKFVVKLPLLNVGAGLAKDFVVAWVVLGFVVMILC